MVFSAVKLIILGELVISLGLRLVLFTNNNLQDDLDKLLPSQAALSTGYVEDSLFLSSDGKPGPDTHVLLAVTFPLRLLSLVPQTAGPAAQHFFAVLSRIEEVGPHLQSVSFVSRNYFMRFMSLLVFRNA